MFLGLNRKASRLKATIMICLDSKERDVNPGQTGVFPLTIRWKYEFIILTMNARYHYPIKLSIKGCCGTPTPMIDTFSKQ